jgi:hypothetical protein
MFKSCTTCGKAIAQWNLKYYTSDQKHFFCDAYCSHEWHSKATQEEKESTSDDE